MTGCPTPSPLLAFEGGGPGAGGGARGPRCPEGPRPPADSPEPRHRWTARHARRSSPRAMERRGVVWTWDNLHRAGAQRRGASSGATAAGASRWSTRSCGNPGLPVGLRCGSGAGPGQQPFRPAGLRAGRDALPCPVGGGGRPRRAAGSPPASSARACRPGHSQARCSASDLQSCSSWSRIPGHRRTRRSWGPSPSVPASGDRAHRRTGVATQQRPPAGGQPGLGPDGHHRPDRTRGRRVTLGGVAPQTPDACPSETPGLEPRPLSDALAFDGVPEKFG